MMMNFLSWRRLRFCLTAGLSLLTLWSATHPPSAARNPQLVDIAASAGLNRPIIYGGVETKKYIIETNGCGVAFYDYDNDGWIDIFLLSGTRLEGFPKGEEPTNRLYRNNRDGTFTDVTRQAGLTRT